MQINYAFYFPYVSVGIFMILLCLILSVVFVTSFESNKNEYTPIIKNPVVAENKHKIEKNESVPNPPMEKVETPIPPVSPVKTKDETETIIQQDENEAESSEKSVPIFVENDTRLQEEEQQAFGESDSEDNFPTEIENVEQTETPKDISEDVSPVSPTVTIVQSELFDSVLSPLNKSPNHTDVSITEDKF